MSDNTQFVAESLAELLVAIADGVREAQDALSNLPSFDAYGRPLPSYHLPYLDFHLQVDMETTQNNAGNRLLKILPASKQTNSRQDISSTLSGRFVAVPPGEGLPIPLLHIATHAETQRRHQINVQLTNSAGEVIAGAAVELNISLDASKKLSAVAGVNLSNLTGTQLQDAVLVTDADGRASTYITLATSLAAQAIVVITADIGQQSVQVSVTAGALA